MKKTLKDICPPGRMPSLSVHRNTKAQREVHQIRKDLVQQAKLVSEMQGIAGYAIVAWTKNWDHKTAWSANSTMPGNTMPEFVKISLLWDISREDTFNILQSPLDDGA